MNERNDKQQKNGGTPLHLTDDSTLQSSSEDRHDKNLDPRKDSSISVSQDDLHATEADRFAGSDRAGTGERKDNTV